VAWTGLYAFEKTKVKSQWEYLDSVAVVMCIRKVCLWCMIYRCENIWRVATGLGAVAVHGDKCVFNWSKIPLLEKESYLKRSKILTHSSDR